VQGKSLQSINSEDSDNNFLFDFFDERHLQIKILMYPVLATSMLALLTSPLCYWIEVEYDIWDKND